jgi:outer membrane protein TolC
MGISPTAQIKVANPRRHPLPRGLKGPVDHMISTALAQRPDVAADYALLQASKAGIAAAKADFLPKVFVAAAASTGQNGFNVNGLPTISSQSTTTGVLAGITVPIFDAGRRAAQLERARSQSAAAAEVLRETQIGAATEVVVAANELRTALESFAAAEAFASAARTTYDAAVEAYRKGLGTVTAVNEANTGLLDARLAEADAYAASLIAASNLAFVMGRIGAGGS